MGSMFGNLCVTEIAFKCTWPDKEKTEYITWDLSKLLWIIFKAA